MDPRRATRSVNLEAQQQRVNFAIDYRQAIEELNQKLQTALKNQTITLSAPMEHWHQNATIHLTRTQTEKLTIT